MPANPYTKVCTRTVWPEHNYSEYATQVKIIEINYEHILGY